MTVSPAEKFDEFFLGETSKHGTDSNRRSYLGEIWLVGRTALSGCFAWA